MGVLGGDFVEHHKIVRGPTSSLDRHTHISRPNTHALSNFFMVYTYILLHLCICRIYPCIGLVFEYVFIYVSIYIYICHRYTTCSNCIYIYILPSIRPMVDRLDRSPTTPLTLSHEKSPAFLSIEFWSFNRDPYFIVYGKIPILYICLEPN